MVLKIRYALVIVIFTPAICNRTIIGFTDEVRFRLIAAETCQSGCRNVDYLRKAPKATTKKKFFFFK